MISDTLIRRGHPIIFGVLILFSCIALALSAWLTSQYNLHHNYGSSTVRDRVRFALFSSVWTLSFSIPLVLFFMLNSASKMTSIGVHIIFLLLTWIMWTAAAASITSMLGGGLNCSTQTSFVYCGQLNALEAFSWIIWIIVTVLLMTVVIRAILSARQGDGYAGPLVD